jgi:hypothetical protein
MTGNVARIEKSARRFLVEAREEKIPLEDLDGDGRIPLCGYQRNKTGLSTGIIWLGLEKSRGLM